MLPYRPGEVPECERLPPAAQRETGTVRREGGGVDVLRRGYELPAALRCAAWRVNVEPPRATSGRVEQPQVGPGVVHEPSTVAGQAACVEVVVMRVPAQVSAIVCARVDVSDALVVGQEID